MTTDRRKSLGARDVSETLHAPDTLPPLIFGSERNVELYTHARLVATGHVTVIESPHVVDAKAFQQVVDTGRNLHVGFSMHLGVTYMLGEFGKYRIL